ncbi:putative EPIDERMAL PATTERNING FACTOR-like protein [Dioscorea sansibarensis]
MELIRVRKKIIIVLLCCIYLYSLFLILLVSTTQEWMMSMEGGGGGGGCGRRRLVGAPGSHPPRCQGKCGRCTPCLPVRVTVPPGTPVTNEYYPEAWRCKCRNRLYMP